MYVRTVLNDLVTTDPFSNFRYLCESPGFRTEINYISQYIKLRIYKSIEIHKLIIPFKHILRFYFQFDRKISLRFYVSEKYFTKCETV